MAAELEAALAVIPPGLRIPLLEQFRSLLTEYNARRWEAVGLKAGKLCEIIYSILAGHVAGRYPTKPSKPRDMVAACRAFEQSDKTFSRSVRIQIPRLLMAVYDLRNHRDIGHIGGDVDPNHMDAELFLRCGKWLMAELVRIFASLNVQESQALVESVTEKSIALIWEGDGTKRVLNPELTTKDKVLALSYSSPTAATAKDLAAWTEYGNLSRFRITVLHELHKKALIHFDKRSDMVTLLPTGVRYVEENGIMNV